jgi:DNA-binding transcriptional MerR regulator
MPGDWTKQTPSALDVLPTKGRGVVPELLSEKELLELERQAPGGFTSKQIVDIFTYRGGKFSEATLRKYVQLGLLPRSVRVGQKGKHQGSRGIYPPNVIRRINTVKTLMAENLTIEEIQRSFAKFKDEIDGIEKSVRSLFSDFEREGSSLDDDRRREFEAEILDAKRAAGDLVRKISSLESRLSNRKAGGAGTVVGDGSDLF